VTLQECTFGAEELAATFVLYQVSVSGPSCILSRLPIVKLDPRTRTDLAAVNGAGMINRFEIWTPRGSVSILNVHLATQRDGLQQLRDQSRGAIADMQFRIAERRIESAAARAWAERSTIPLIIAGDFNMPAESSIFRRYWGDYTDAYGRCSTGYGYTKWTRWWGIRIDHVLYDDRWECLGVLVYRSMGGDHQPLIVDLRRR
jgi:endonuclease/exonuclease/phosphatase family metal-dependent hydrolase